MTNTTSEKQEKCNKYYGFYRGTVVQQLTNGFCKIRIPGVLAYDDVDKLPPAESATDIAGGTGKNGTFSYPDVNSTVWCFFEQGDVNRPVYFAGSHSHMVGWSSKNVAVAEQQNIEGYTLAKVTAVGKTMSHDNASINMSSALNTNTQKIENTKIELAVQYNSELAENVTETFDDTNENNRVIHVAAGIVLDNATGKVTINAANTIELNAPNIIINSKNLGKSGTITLHSDNITADAAEEIKFTNNVFTNKSDAVINLKAANEWQIYT